MYKTYFRENIVVWPSKPKKHQNNGQIQITKVLDGVDPLEFVIKVLNRIRFPTWVSIDFHGFFKTPENELKFEFASRWTGIKFHDDEEDDLFLYDGTQMKRAKDFLKKMDSDMLLSNWFNSHVMELGYSAHSGLIPYRLVAAVLYLEPQGNTVEEIFGI